MGEWKTRHFQWNEVTGEVAPDEQAAAGHKVLVAAFTGEAKPKDEPKEPAKNPEFEAKHPSGPSGQFSLHTGAGAQGMIERIPVKNWGAPWCS